MLDACMGVPRRTAVLKRALNRFMPFLTALSKGSGTCSAVRANLHLRDAIRAALNRTVYGIGLGLRDENAIRYTEVRYRGPAPMGSVRVSPIICLCAAVSAPGANKPITSAAILQREQNNSFFLQHVALVTAVSSVLEASPIHFSAFCIAHGARYLGIIP